VLELALSIAQRRWCVLCSVLAFPLQSGDCVRRESDACR
jgi:hypothetical protein